MKRSIVAAVLLLTLTTSLHAAATLRVIKAGPIGEVAQLAEANEVRVVFSEPMVAVAKIPKNLAVPWFHIAPAVDGTFRWSGTTTLIFTPKAPLPFATEFNVTIDKAATSVAGNTLDRDYKFSFTTPTIQLLAVPWYRKGDEATGPVVIGLRFNQPVDADTIASHVHFRTKGHEFTAPATPEGDQPAFKSKLEAAQKAAASNGDPVFAGLATTWDKKRIEPGKNTVVFETKPNIPPDTWIEVYLDSRLASGPKNVRTGRGQDFTVQLWPTFFVENISCSKACNPDSQNAITFRRAVTFADARKAITVSDVTDPAHEVKLKQVLSRDEEHQPDENEDQYVSLDELGYSLQPAHTYRVRVDSSLTSTDNQRLGYDFVVTVVNWHRTAFTSFGDGHGVWESSGGPILPFSSRNFRSVKQWLAPLALDQLMPTIVDLQNNGFQKTPPSQPQDRKLSVVPDKIQAYGLDVTPAVGADNKGLVWAAVQEGDPIAQSRTYGSHLTRSTIVQVTNLGISVKDSPLNTLVMVTRLDNAAPVAGANVSIRTLENSVFWTGTTDANGIAMVPNTNLRVVKRETPPPQPGTMQREPDEEDYQWEALGLRFIVTAEKDGDIAYAASDWHEGIMPWDFGLNFNLNEARSMLRGTIFTDRGVYKLGEDVHVKAVVRSDTAGGGMQLLPAGTKLDVVLRDSHDQEIDKRTVALNEWSSAEWTLKIPADAPLGNYRFIGRIEGQRLQTFGDFLVAAYRRPEFRVDVTLDGPSTIAGVQLNGTINGRYLFGAPMSGAAVKWTYAKHFIFDVPSKVTERFPEDRYTFLGWEEGRSGSYTTVAEKEAKLDAKGELHLELDTKQDEGWPAEYRLEGNVTDVSRQQIAGRTTYRVDPAPWYIGVRRPPYFADTKSGIDTDIVAVTPDGLTTAGVNVTVELYQIQWVGARQAEGHGFYEWDMTRKEVPAGNWTVTTQSQPAPLHMPLENGGEYLIIAKASDGEGRTTKTRVDFYAVGAGYTSWERYDNNRIDLVPEKKSYKPGDTARIMIKSPWEHATALLTTEREGVRTSTPFELTSTQQTVTVPITEKDIPNVFVSVLLVKGRTKDTTTTEDESDPGKPTFRVGYTELKVEDAIKRLKVDVKANRDEYRPASKARIEVNVRDANNAAAQSEVTLWAVDYGVLSLTAYQTPDVLESIYLDKALQVITEDSREKVISRRVITPKGAGEGGGGGRDSGPGMLRKDFRVLAFWLGSIVTDKNGRARTDVTLPESLTTYRIMAVAGDRQSRFGWGQNEIRINKPLLLTPTFPRFLAINDKAYFGAVVHSQLKKAGTATVTIKSLDPNVIEFTDPATQTTDVAIGGNAEVRWNAIAKSVGSARIQVSVSMNGERDAFEDSIPVRVFVTPETFAAYGQANPTAKETIERPADVVPGFGGLHLELASTMMVGLGEGARYLVDYPYGCAEQRASSALALMLSSDLGNAFNLPGIDPAKTRDVAQTTLNELPKFQCGDGGFAYWAGDCSSSSPYLTSYVLHVMQRGQKLNYTVDKNVLDHAYDYLDRNLGERRAENESWVPAYTAWQAFAVKVLVEGGRNEDSHINRLMGYLDRMPVFGISYLADALMAKGETGKRVDELHRRMSNAILPEGGSAHVEELADPYLLWFWNSNVRSTAIVLGTLVRNGQDEELVRRMVRWMMQVRKKGRWGNTQENAWAMESLVDYYRKYESETPDFTAVATIGSETLARETFKGRSTEAKSRDIPMAQVPSGTVTFEKQGPGILFYLMRLRYAPLGIFHDALDQGFHIERSYDKSAFAAGDLIKVTLRVRNTKERRFVAITDPIPAGTEPVESWFATTATDLVAENQQTGTWLEWWQRGGFDHVERHDDRVDLFATRLSEGPHEFTYLIRATTAGTFITAPTHAEEMYEPEVFGRTATTVVEVKP